MQLQYAAKNNPDHEGSDVFMSGTNFSLATAKY